MANANTNIDGITEPFAATRQVTAMPSIDGQAPVAETLYPPQGPDPAGTKPEALAEMKQGAGASPETGAGIEGEEVVWEARYSLKNFIGRFILWGGATVAWVALAVWTWGYGSQDLAPFTVILGCLLVIAWLFLLYRVTQACYGHYYRLTNRRLFVSTGLIQRRRDQMELLRVKDVFTKQSLIERWLSVGTVVVVSTERETPVFYLAGVNDAKQVMDLVWHHARAERDNRSTKIDSV